MLSDKGIVVSAVAGAGFSGTISCGATSSCWRNASTTTGKPKATVAIDTNDQSLPVSAGPTATRSTGDGDGVAVGMASAGAVGGGVTGVCTIDGRIANGLVGATAGRAAITNVQSIDSGSATSKDSGEASGCFASNDSGAPAIAATRSKGPSVTMGADSGTGTGASSGTGSISGCVATSTADETTSPGPANGSEVPLPSVGTSISGAAGTAVATSAAGGDIGRGTGSETGSTSTESLIGSIATIGSAGPCAVATTA